MLQLLCCGSCIDAGVGQPVAFEQLFLNVGALQLLHAAASQAGRLLHCKGGLHNLARDCRASALIN